jgi:hypothetical protein
VFIMTFDILTFDIFAPLRGQPELDPPTHAAAPRGLARVAGRWEVEARGAAAGATLRFEQRPTNCSRDLLPEYQNNVAPPHPPPLVLSGHAASLTPY